MKMILMLRGIRECMTSPGRLWGFNAAATSAASGTDGPPGRARPQENDGDA